LLRLIRKFPDMASGSGDIGEGGYWGGSRSDDPVGDHGGEARGKATPSLMINYQAFEMPEM
jgi:hypothetical protein